MRFDLKKVGEIPDVVTEENGKLVCRINGQILLDVYDGYAAQEKEKVMQELLENLEFQVQRSNGTWVSIDPLRVRLATKGVK